MIKEKEQQIRDYIKEHLNTQCVLVLKMDIVAKCNCSEKEKLYQYNFIIELDIF
jgi:hypothetical protein